MTWQTLKSHEDASVNFVKHLPDNGFWEARFVQRVPHYFITYLSSHSGCNKACRFCHLTATKQTMMMPATLFDYADQAEQVLSYYRNSGKHHSEKTEQIVNFNFMARGEPLANPVVLHNSKELFDILGKKATDLGLKPQFMISSIIPADFNGKLEDIFSDERATLYYSLYSTQEKFRKRWLPKAMDCYKSLDLIAEFQKKTGRQVVLHWAFIEGQNDNIEELHKTMQEVKARGINARFNLVRYNPHSDRYGVEPDEEHIINLFETVKSYLPESNSRIVPRVGHDVKASCGMFIDCKSI